MKMRDAFALCSKIIFIIIIIYENYVLIPFCQMIFVKHPLKLTFSVIS